MIFSWWKNRRRRKLLSKPFPTEWDQWIHQNVVYVSSLSVEEYRRLQQWIQIFIAEKYWEGCDGLTITEEMQTTIAAQAGFLVHGWDEYYFDHLKTILVYPRVVWRKDPRPKGGVINEDPTGRLGEALLSGPVSLVWPHVLLGGRREQEGSNVVFHEFAHVLDGQDQFLDGTPHMESAEIFDRWKRVLHAEYQSLVNSIHRGQPTLIDPYGATNIAEFFAVSTECFFERPHDMSNRHAEWYELLKEYYKLDPADFAI